MRTPRTAAVAVVLAASIFFVPVLAAGPPSPRACIVGMNKAGAGVAAAAQDDARYCARSFFDLPAGVDGQACLSADLRGRTAKAGEGVASIDVGRCGASPSFGYTGAATVTAAGRTLALDLVADLFGPDFGAALGSLDCQSALLRNLRKLTAAKLRAFRDCKKAGLANGAIADASSLEGCLTDLDTDPRGKIARALQRLADDDARICGDVDRDQVFPGYCRFAPGDLVSCADARTRCRVCEALNRMDGLALDCETFDDGAANGSCGPCIPDPDGVCCNLADRDECGFCGGTGFRCDWAEISVAPSHACGRRTDGTLACWGPNYAGERAAPAGVFTQLTSGGSSSEVPIRGHSCALRVDQTATCWGRNDYGQASPPAETFSELAAGSHHTCGLRTDGTVVCWGLNDFGQASAPAGTFTRMSASRRGTCALRTDGEVECWGYSSYGSLSPLPGPFTDVATGAVQSYGIRPDQTLARWGDALPQFEPEPGLYVEVDVGVVNGCGRRPDGTLACWPDTPAEIALEAPSGSFSQLDAGENIYCAVRDDGVLACWGDLFTQSGPPPR